MTDRRLAGALLCALASGACGHVVDTGIREERRVLSSRPVTLHPDGPIVVEAAGVANERLTARLSMVALCQPAVEDEIAYQKIDVTRTEGDVGDLVLGLGGLGISGGLIANRGSFSDKPGVDDKGEETASDRDLATAWAGIAGVAGLGLALHGLYYIAKSGERDLPNPMKGTETGHRGLAKPCGTSPLAPGAIVAIDDGGVVATWPAVPPGISVELRSPALHLCERAGSRGPVELAFVTPARARELETQKEGRRPRSGDAIGYAHLATWDAGPCRAVSLARQALAEAGELMDGAERGGGQVKLEDVARSLDAARERVGAVPAEDRDRPELERTANGLRTRMGERAAKAITSALAAYAPAVNEGKANRAALLARIAFALVNYAPERREAVAGEVYGPLLAPSVPLAGALEVLRALGTDGDPERANCLRAGGAACAPPMEYDRERARFAPLDARLRGEVDAARAEMAKTSAALSKKPTEPNGAALRASISRAESLIAPCEVAWEALTNETCEALKPAVEAAQSVLVAQEERLRLARIARTAAAWKSIVPRCERLQQWAQLYRSLGSCDAGCQRSKVQAEAEYEQLRAFQVTDSEFDEKTLQTVRSACQTAGCPVCP